LIRVFVGSAEKFRVCEEPLRRSVQENTKSQFSITFMRPETLGIPETGCTGFSNLRFLVPELAGHSGFAIYLDVDMLLLGDIAELWAHRTPGQWVALQDGSTEVSVIDCEVDYGLPAYEDIANFKIWEVLETLRTANKIGAEWNSEDRITPGAKLLHFTDLKQQPWFFKHQDKTATAIWDYYSGNKTN